MKKLAIAMMMGIAAMSASAQVNYKMQVACNPQDVKTYNTNRLRSSFLMEKVMVPDQINVTYSMYDRLIFGGAVPATKELVLETIDPLKAKYFLERRELGVINIGGEGIVTVDGKEYTLNFKDALYVGRGKQKVTFKSKDASKPAKFYINSATAHKEYKTQLITIAVWKHISTSTCRKATPSATSWANLRKNASYGCRTNKLSCHRNGLSTQLPEPATICSSGVWLVKILTMATWIRLNIQKCANLCAAL